MLASLSAITVILFRPVPVVVRTNLENLPMNIAGFTGIEDVFPKSVYRELNADKNIYRHYLSRDGYKLDLYIGYYGTAKGGRTGHNPYACLPGAGWAIVDTSKVRIFQTTHSLGVEVNYIHARKDDINTVMVHWYQNAGSIVMSTGIQQNIARFWNRLLYNRNDGAFIRITAQVSDNEMPGTKIKIRDFAGQVLQLLPNYWPLEQ
jgi:EpsI family protein